MSINEKSAKLIRDMATKMANKKIRRLDDLTDRDNGQYMLWLLDGGDISALARHARGMGLKWTGAYAS